MQVPSFAGKCLCKFYAVKQSKTTHDLFIISQIRSVPEESKGDTMLVLCEVLFASTEHVQ